MDFDAQAQIYNEVGASVVEQIGTVETKILIYAVLTSDGMDYSIFYLQPDRNSVRSLPAQNAVATSLFKLQLHVEALPIEQRWTAMKYWINYGEVNISLTYDKIDENVPHWERSPVVVEEYFPGLLVNPD